jgi:alkylated DNA repair dioxygenase AlkB
MRQEELFGAIATAERPEIPGFSIRHDYIDPDEEHYLLQHLESGPWESDWRRRIQQYGLGYGSKGGAPVWLRDFPEWLVALAARVAKDTRFERFPENCVINEYIPPLGIGPHKDYPAFGPTIACVSLGSDVVTDFRHARRGLKVSVHVPARSLWVITGEARSQWQHGIAARFTDMIHGERRRRARRVSITFRTARDANVARPS